MQHLLPHGVIQMNLFQRQAGAPRRQRDAATVELALLLTATMALMPALVLFARVFYQYGLLKQASQDAASYLAALPVAAITDWWRPARPSR